MNMPLLLLSIAAVSSAVFAYSFWRTTKRRLYLCPDSSRWSRRTRRWMVFIVAVLPPLSIAFLAMPFALANMPKPYYLLISLFAAATAGCSLTAWWECYRRKPCIGCKNKVDLDLPICANCCTTISYEHALLTYIARSGEIVTISDAGPYPDVGATAPVDGTWLCRRLISHAATDASSSSGDGPNTFKFADWVRRGEGGVETVYVVHVDTPSDENTTLTLRATAVSSHEHAHFD